MSNRLPPFTEGRLLDALRSLPVVKKYLVGFSGGADSTALLLALSNSQDPVLAPFSAVHINHGLHPDADHWQKHCEAFCAQHAIKLICLSIDLDKHSGKGMEAAARHQRYEAQSSLLEPGDCLLTAHHADDQAETLLLNLMRGSGVDGLAAMPECRPLGKGLLQRPLLQFPGNELRSYLQKNNTDWLEDPSNQVLVHDRNFMRHQVIPLLESRWPGVCKSLLLTRKTMAETRSLLERVADEHLRQSLHHPWVLKIEPQLGQETELFKLVVRRWLVQAKVPSIPAYRLDSLSGQVRNANSDHKIAIRWDGWWLRLYQQQLWLHRDTTIAPCPSVQWPAGQMDINLGEDVGQLSIRGQGPAVLPSGFSVSCRNSNNESIKQAGHHRSLKNLFQSAGIPPWLRDSVPLCSLEGELVAMGDWCFNEWFTSWLAENEVSLAWQPQNPLLQFILTRQR